MIYEFTRIIVNNRHCDDQCKHGVGMSSEVAVKNYSTQAINLPDTEYPTNEIEMRAIKLQQIKYKRTL
jgi:hypothetical protein